MDEFHVYYALRGCYSAPAMSDKTEKNPDVQNTGHPAMVSVNICLDGVIVFGQAYIDHVLHYRIIMKIPGTRPGSKAQETIGWIPASLCQVP